MNFIKNEFKNFIDIKSLNKLPLGYKYLLYDVHLGQQSPDDTYHKLHSIFKTIISIFSTGKWPSDEQWRKEFFFEFNEHFPDLTREQCDEMLKSTKQRNWNKLPWDFGSWLDVLKRRTWIWVGHERKEKYLHIALLVNDPNASDLEAFHEIFSACNAKIVRREALTL